VRITAASIVACKVRKSLDAHERGGGGGVKRQRRAVGGEASAVCQSPGSRYKEKGRVTSPAFSHTALRTQRQQHF
jgi:hypothetical protein